MTVRVLIVDDQEPFRLAAAAVVAATPGFEVVGEVATGEESLIAAVALRPDLVLMDVRLPGIDGVTATRHIRGADPTITVLLLSTYDSEDYGTQVAESGAAGFLPKARFGPDVLNSVAGPAKAR